MHKKLVLFSLLSIISFDAMGAGLRDPREIFNQPATGRLTQVFLGLSEAGVAKMVWPGLAQEEKALAAAEKELALTRRLPTSEIERNARIEAQAAVIARSEATAYIPKVLPVDPRLPSAAEELQFLTSNGVVSAQEKAALIVKAEEAVAERSRMALIAAQEAGYLSKAVRVARYGTSVLLGLDIASRVYIFNILDANPGLTPVVGFSAEQIRAILGN
ncbi:MAG: hypothetical protein KF799_08475 [Bdellovibrionales bacterium]|nr:hypothetical protein [Bdellovibrionales bacterium]